MTVCPVQNQEEFVDSTAPKKTLAILKGQLLILRTLLEARYFQVVLKKYFRTTICNTIAMFLSVVHKRPSKSRS